MNSAEVVIVQRRLTHYRVPLFELMRPQLQDRGIRLRVLAGDPMPSELKKNDSGKLPWVEHLPTRYFLNGRVCWQPFLKYTREANLIVVTQENKHVNNLLALASPWRGASLAFWGHGRNLQSENPDGFLERFKRWNSRQVDWWFAYTELSSKIVRESGFSADRITVLNNSIDTAQLVSLLSRVRKVPRSVLRSRMDLGKGPIAIYLGSLYNVKRVGFLLESAIAIKRRVPSFELVVGGAGSDSSLIEQAARDHRFIKYFGSVWGHQKAELLAVADVMLNPGMVGLGLLDAFVAGIPFFTTDCGLHSPEISYLRDGKNGILTENSIDAFVDSVVAVVTDSERMSMLQMGALDSAVDYSIENMACRFCDGIVKCLNNVQS